MSENIKKKIEEIMHSYYYDLRLNCARASLDALSEIFNVEICDQVRDAAIGLHGAGGKRDQCGLVEGPLMFIGIYFTQKKVSKETIIQYCYDFAVAFENEFGSIMCRDLRPQGFSPDQPPAMCGDLTCRTVWFSYNFIKSLPEADKV
ncbi:MAG: C-GCAxxG-C-C family protein [Eubacteriaceae bacterium]